MKYSITKLGNHRHTNNGNNNGERPQKTTTLVW